MIKKQIVSLQDARRSVESLISTQSDSCASKMMITNMKSSMFHIVPKISDITIARPSGRALLAALPEPMRDIAKSYNVSHSTILRLVS